MKQYVKYNRHCEGDFARHCEEVRRSNLSFHFNGLLRSARNDVYILLLLLFSLSTHATIITVKQDGSGNFTNIQAGINAASSGDTVLVWPGTYFENIDYLSKNITVASLYFIAGIHNYINSTIIDGAYNGSCVYISDITGSNATLCGFTLQHGSGSWTYSNTGGGIKVIASTISIDHCIIKNNKCIGGGGISCLNSNIVMSGNIIKNNIALFQGGGIHIAAGSQITFDSIQKNSVYLNYGPNGCDISKTTAQSEQHIILDTATVLSPDNYFFYSQDSYGNPINMLTWEVDHGKIEQVNADLYVSAINGNNENSGLTQSDPLKTISFALCKIASDSINPKSIHIDHAIYSPETDEIFPICLRNYVSLVGADVESTIIDADHLYPLSTSKGYPKTFALRNLTFTRGFDLNQIYISSRSGLELVASNNVLLDNIHITDTWGQYGSALNSRASGITLSNSRIYNNLGGLPIDLSNSSQNYKEFKIINSSIFNNGPGISYQGMGGGVGIVGYSVYPNNFILKFINLLINNNTRTEEEGFESQPTCGLACTDYARVDVINTTIANNIVTNPGNSTQVYAMYGAKVNFYNSIVYGTEDYEIYLGDGTPTSEIATVNISNTDVKGGEENIQNWNNIHILNWLDGNIDENPLWSGLGDDPYSLQPGSPCINAGVPMYVVGMDYPYIKEENNKYILYMLDGDTVTLPATDLASNPRISGGRIDMGAYEWQDTATIVEGFKVQSSGLNVYPNPFVSNTFISFTTCDDHYLTLEVINLSGERMRTIAVSRFPAGIYRLVWDGKDDSGFDVNPGFYIVCLYLDGVLNSTTSVSRTRR